MVRKLLKGRSARIIVTMGMPATVYRYYFRGMVTPAAMAILPMGFAVAGAFIDERARLGFSLWRSACRANGLTLESLARFTLQLLPTAVLGALFGGLVVLGFGMLLRHRGCAADALGAHAGCVVGMAAGLLLCTLPLPVPVLLAGEAALTLGLALFLRRLLPARAPEVPRTTGLTSA
jgi:hypothetical protein